MSDFLKVFEIQLIEKLETILDEFYEYLLDARLKPSTAEAHTANAELFLIEYHAFQYLEDASHITPFKVMDFLGTWYYQRIEYPNRKDVLAILKSIKRLFQFLHRKKIISKEDKDNLKKICDNQDFFLTNFDRYEEDANNSSLEDHDDEDDIDDIDDFDDDDMTQPEIEEFVEDFLYNAVMDSDDLEDESIFDQQLTYRDILNQMREICGREEQQNNLIILQQDKPKQKLRPKKLVIKHKSSLKSLQEHTLDLHRSNQVFERCLFRFLDSPFDVDPELASIHIHCDELLVYLLMQLNQEKISRADILDGHTILDTLTYSLWKIRTKMASSAELDINLLPL